MERRQREREQELERERERMRERDRERERELQRERDHKELLEKLLRTTKNTPIAAITPVGPLSFPMPQLPPPTQPPPTQPPTPPPTPPAQIQAPPTQNNDFSMGTLSTPSLAQYNSMSGPSGTDWYSEGGNGEIFSATNLGGGIYE